MTLHEWDAESYDAISAPQQAWGARSSSGSRSRRRDRARRRRRDGPRHRGAARTAAARPRHRRRPLTGDGRRRARAPPRGPVTVICADLLELELPEPVDAIVSTATFHWILDHDALFARMRAPLAGGQFVAQCGGVGNIAARPRRRRATSHRRSPTTSRRSHRPGITRRRRKRAAPRAGRLCVDGCWLEPRPTTPRARASSSRPFCSACTSVPAGRLREPFLDALLAGSRPALIDYVRLNWDARARDVSQARGAPAPDPRRLQGSRGSLLWLLVAAAPWPRSRRQGESSATTGACCSSSTPMARAGGSSPEAACIAARTRVDGIRREIREELGVEVAVTDADRDRRRARAANRGGG